MLEICHIALRARDPGRNVHRAYRLSLGRDLFDMWTVELRYGRIGRTGHSRRVACRTVEEARRVARAYLRRRLSAPRRIGCAYEIVSYEAGGAGVLTPDLPAFLSPPIIACATSRIGHPDGDI